MREYKQKRRGVKPALNAAVSQHALSITPGHVYAYFHKCVFFKEQILSRADRRRLKQLGFRIRPRDLREADDGSLIQPKGHKLTISCPSREALEALSKFKDAMPYSSELALDMIHRDEEAAGSLQDDMERTIVQPRQSGQVRKWKGHGVFYTGPRLKGRSYNLIALYADRPSNITGEFACVHLERRCVGIRTLRAIGIGSVQDMLSFDPAAHWNEYLPRLFLHFDPIRYGRVYDNRMKGIKRRRSKETKIGERIIHNRDGSRGSILFRNLSLHEKKGHPSRSLQRFVQQVGRDPRFLHAIPVSSILDKLEVKWAEPTHSLSVERTQSHILIRKPSLPEENRISNTKPKPISASVEHRTPNQDVSASQPNPDYA